MSSSDSARLIDSIGSSGSSRKTGKVAGYYEGHRNLVSWTAWHTGSTQTFTLTLRQEIHGLRFLQACPASTELEIIVLDWVAKFLNLPEFFYSNFSNKDSHGGGVIQGSASDAILLSMIAARERAVKELRNYYPNKHRTQLLKMLVAYGNSQCHSAVEKAAMISNVNLRLLEPGSRGSLRFEILQEAFVEDTKKGYFPFFVSAILGSTTSICAFYDLEEIGPVCKLRNIWLHVDGAYAGSSFACPETRHLMRGMQYAWSFNCNCNKWMLTNFDCSLHWFKNKYDLIDCLSGNDESLHDKLIVDHRHWSLAHTRRFRALKLWFVIRTYGVEGIRSYIRKHIYMAKVFERYVFRDPRFVAVAETRKENHKELENMGELIEAQKHVDAFEAVEMLEEADLSRQLSEDAILSIQEIHQRRLSGEEDQLVLRSTLLDPFFKSRTSLDESTRVLRRRSSPRPRLSALIPQLHFKQ